MYIVGNVCLNSWKTWIQMMLCVGICVYCVIVSRLKLEVNIVWKWNLYQALSKQACALFPYFQHIKKNTNAAATSGDADLLFKQSLWGVMKNEIDPYFLFTINDFFWSLKLHLQVVTGLVFEWLVSVFNFYFVIVEIKLFPTHLWVLVCCLYNFRK